MIQSFASAPRYLALTAVLLAAASLAACGRKGPLEPPPSAQLTQPSTANPADGHTAQAKPKEPPPAMDENGRPLAQPGEKKHVFLDFLLN